MGSVALNSYKNAVNVAGNPIKLRPRPLPLSSDKELDRENISFGAASRETRSDLVFLTSVVCFRTIIDRP